MSLEAQLHHLSELPGVVVKCVGSRSHTGMTIPALPLSKEVILGRAGFLFVDIRDLDMESCVLCHTLVILNLSHLYSWDTSTSIIEHW